MDYIIRTCNNTVTLNREEPNEYVLAMVMRAFKDRENIVITYEDGSSIEINPST